MFKLAILVLAFAAVAFAAPADITSPVPILRESRDGPNPDGSYAYSFEAGNGVKAEEEGHLENQGTDDEGMSVRGSYSYMGEDGVLVQVTYVADKNGFRAEGAHLPTPPPIPEAILKSLEHNARHPEEDDIDASKH